MQPISSALGNQTVLLDHGALRLATFGERVIRWVNWNKAASQDNEVAEYLIENLALNKNYIPEVTKFAKNCKSTHDAFKRLENVLFSFKCEELLSLSTKDLIHADGSSKGKLLGLIKNNFLHYVIGKAHAHDKETAILVYSNQIFIRAKEGSSFLNDAIKIDSILQKLPASHEDRASLEALKAELKGNRSQDQLLALQQSLKGHYNYILIDDLPVNHKGLLLSRAYLSQGIEEHDSCGWENAKACFIEKTSTPGYKLRVVTRLPEYGVEKRWIPFLTIVFRNLFNFRAHGHSWVELVEPVLDQKGNMTGEQRVYSIGYYFHPINSYKRFQNADPMSYMPIPKEFIVMDRANISKDQFDKGLLYINEIQHLIRNPNWQLNDKPQNPSLSDQDIQKIQQAYKSAIKGTCLGFANVFREILTGIEKDHRTLLQKLFWDKKTIKIWDRIDPLIEQSYLLQQLIRPFRFFSRMELPFMVTRRRLNESRQ